MTIDQRRNHKGDFKIFRENENKNTYVKLMGYSENSAQWEIYSYKCLY